MVKEPFNVIMFRSIRLLIRSSTIDMDQSPLVDVRAGDDAVGATARGGGRTGTPGMRQTAYCGLSLCSRCTSRRTIHLGAMRSDCTPTLFAAPGMTIALPA